VSHDASHSLPSFTLEAFCFIGASERRRAMTEDEIYALFDDPDYQELECAVAARSTPCHPN
jgi:hypothetical protein